MTSTVSVDAIESRILLSAERGRVRQLEIANCDFKLGRYSTGAVNAPPVVWIPAFAGMTILRGNQTCYSLPIRHVEDLWGKPTRDFSTRTWR